MGTHTLLVKAYIDGDVKPRGSVVVYDGPPNWKFEPIDPVERAAWEIEVADPARVEENRKQASDWDYDAPPPPPRADERGYTPQMIANMSDPAPRYDRYKDL